MYLSICFIVFPSLFFALPFAIFLIALLVKFSAVASVQSLRHDAISRSPVNSLFSTTLENLVTVRAYRKEQTINSKFQNLVDESGRAYFTYLAVGRWLAFWL